jgi:hypothetical protein
MSSRMTVAGEIMRPVQAMVTGDGKVATGPAGNRMAGFRTALAVVGALVAAMAFGVVDQWMSMRHQPSWLRWAA